MKLRSHLLAAAAAMTLLLTGCGSDDDASPGPGNPTEFLRSLILTYKAGTPAEDVKTYPVDQGKVVNVQVNSDTAGDVVISGLNLSQPVEANKSTLLIFSANDEAKYDLVLRTKSGDALIAKLDVQE